MSPRVTWRPSPSRSLRRGAHCSGSLKRWSCATSRPGGLARCLCRAGSAVRTPPLEPGTIVPPHTSHCRSADPCLPLLPCVRSAAVPPLPPVRSDGCVVDGTGQPEADDHRMVPGTPCLCRRRQRRVVQAGQEHRPARRLRPALLLLQVLSKFCFEHTPNGTPALRTPAPNGRNSPVLAFRASSCSF